MSELKKISEALGGAVFTGDALPNVRRLLAPSIGINVATYGGLPLGRIVFLAGQEATGKTSFLYTIIADLQKTTTLPVVLLDSELSFSEERANAFAVNKKNLVLSTPGTLEEGLDGRPRAGAWIARTGSVQMKRLGEGQ